MKCLYVRDVENDGSGVYGKILVEVRTCSIGRSAGDGGGGSGRGKWLFFNEWSGGKEGRKEWCG